ncbi:MAG TPA: V-type ATP synthase subunit E family protein [Gallionellaceae bacterium]
MSTDQAADLEAALIARAELLAQEFLAGASRRREELLAESSERLHLREEHEILSARAAADKLQRQQVQSAEIRLQGEYDRLRWTLVQAVLTQLDEAVAELANDEERYLPILARFIATAAAAIEADTLVVQLNAQDLARLNKRWESFSKDLAPGKTLQLSQQPLHCSGGALLHDSDDRVRVNQTFEGRKQRLGEMLAQVVLEELFATVK